MPDLPDSPKSRKFHQSAEMAFVALLRTAEEVAAREEEFLRPHGLTLTQYNVLRVLEAVFPEGLTCGEIGKRMITRVPDVTRLLDRLEKTGHIERRRETADRRRVTARLSARGLRLLQELEGPSAEFHAGHLGRLGGEKLRNLVITLNEIRGL